MREVVIRLRVWGPHTLNLALFFWIPFAYSENSVVLLRSKVRLAIYLLHIHIRVRIATQYPRRCLNVHPNPLIQVKFLRY